MAFTDRINTVIDRIADESAARARARAYDECISLALQWSAAREPEYGGHALRNFADDLKRRKAVSGVQASHMVPLSDDGKSVFIDGFGEVPLAYPNGVEGLKR